MPDVLVYGASGFTGQLVVEKATEAGMKVVVAGRRAESLADVAGDHELRVFPLDDPAQVRRGLSGVRCVINAAGPFVHTMEPLLEGCLTVGAHYLDTSGELQAFDQATRKHDEAQRADVMVMPGAGWDVVASDSVAWLTARVTDPRVLRLVLRHNEHHVRSHGSARTLNWLLSQDHLWRQAGELVSMKGAPPRQFDLGEGPTLYYPFPMADPVSSWWSTRIPTIEVYGAFSLENARPIDEARLARTPRGPGPEVRPRIRSAVLAEVEGADGRTARTLLETVGGHEFTALAALDIADRCLRDEYLTGYQSPASAYGADLLDSVPGCTLSQLA